MLKRVALLLALCLATALTPVHALAQDLTVSAAASLKEAFAEIAKQFEGKHAGVKVVLNIAASGPLAQQIEQGAPVDVFVSANQKWMNTLAEKKKIDPATRFDLVANALALAVPSANPAGVKTLADLKNPAVKALAIGTPESVPAGQYARKLLEKNALWTELSGKLVMGESVRQVLDYLSRAEAEAGFVYITDAVKAKDKVRVVQEFGAAELGEPVTYPAAMVAGAPQPELARKFLDHLISPEGRKVLDSHGFQRP